MQILDLPTELIAALRETARDATMQAARAFGLGGSTWEVLRPSGSGMAARSLPPSGPDALAYLYRRRPGRAQPAAPGAVVGVSEWGMVLISGDVQPGDRLVSRADGRLATTVRSLEPWYEYAQGDIDPLPYGG